MSRLFRSGLGTLTVIVVSALFTGAALAVWSVAGSGAAGGTATTMPTGNAPTATATANVTSVTVSWTAADITGSTAVTGYIIKRYNAINGSQATVGSACSGLVTNTSCTESNVPAGNWLYTDTPVEANWTGGDSPLSNAVTVP
jgi:hypothetical protein